MMQDPSLVSVDGIYPKINFLYDTIKNHVSCIRIDWKANENISKSDR